MVAVVSFCAAVREQLMVDRGERVLRTRAARRVDPEHVTERRDDHRLVEGDPQLDAVFQAFGNEPGILGEPFRGVAVQPAARVLQGLRQPAGTDPAKTGPAGSEPAKADPAKSGLD